MLDLRGKTQMTINVKALETACYFTDSFMLKQHSNVKIFKSHNVALFCDCLLIVSLFLLLISSAFQPVHNITSSLRLYLFTPALLSTHSSIFYPFTLSHFSSSATPPHHPPLACYIFIPDLLSASGLLHAAFCSLLSCCPMCTPSLSSSSLSFVQPVALSSSVDLRFRPPPSFRQ